MQKKFLKGNYAVAEAAIAAGCRHFYGYPITPQSEIMEHMSKIMPEAGGTFVQAESEVGAINMVLGSAAAGALVMTASSGPGIDLMQEGISNLHTHQLPVVIAQIMRAGPGDGGLHPTQADYDQAIRGGRADTRNIVLAPSSAQEMYDFTILAFQLAEKYRNPTFLLTESYVGQIYESLNVYNSDWEPQPRPYAITGAKDRERRLSIAHFPQPVLFDEFQTRLQEKYRMITEKEQRSESFMTEDAELIVVAFGITARNCKAAVLALRKRGIKVGLFRPKTLWPFPAEALNHALSNNKKLLIVEMTAGQMTRDIAILTRRFDYVLRPGQAYGEVPKVSQISAWISEMLL
ncbi:MAG: 3-methyl-2-oxobutanoate dehydrogenase subunit VorB [Clostridiaceae bacterium]|jgi:2-oxoglutarate ferredoxin oxidoreductase subunit alpha|nr:3-methyl-2-oxobutanoate dehydrogenase subunit VorB [Clostridiaceae bacterium]